MLPTLALLLVVLHVITVVVVVIREEICLAELLSTIRDQGQNDTRRSEVDEESIRREVRSI